MGNLEETQKMKKGRPEENTARRKIGPYTRAKKQKRKRGATGKNMPNKTDDTDGSMKRAEKKEKQDTWEIQTTRKHDQREMGRRNER